jgi:hypothetical protein
MPFQVREWEPYPIDEKHPREDIRLKPYAEKLGFKAETDSSGFWIEGVPYNSYIFRKGKVSIWYVGPMRCSTRLPQKGDWMAADKVKGGFGFGNYRSYEGLKAALEAEK